MKPGRPDLEGGLNGWHIMIEVKKNDGVLSEEQKIHIRNGIKSGSLAYVARGDQALPKLIDKLIRRGII